MSQIYFTSDNHFGHFNVIRYTDRPFDDTLGMDATMIARWNERVKPEDTVYHLGDFALVPRQNIEYLLQKLNGIKHLVKGNHDRGLNAMRDAGFTTTQDHLFLTIAQYNIVMVHDPRRLDVAVEEHAGLVNKLGRQYGIRDAINIALCGHVHEKWKIRQYRYPIRRVICPLVNAGVDQWDFKPVTFDEILDFIYNTDEAPIYQAPETDDGY